MQIQSFQDNQSETNKKIVNDAVRICVSCGNIAIKIQNHGIFCKDCGTFFDVEREKTWWVSIPAEVSVDTMMQMQNLEIQEIAHLENIALSVI